MKFTNKHFRETKNQILIKNSKLYGFLESFLTILHLSVFIVGILTLTNLVVGINHSVKLTMEILTLLLIFMVIFLFFFMKRYKYFLVKKYLGKYWGHFIVKNIMYVTYDKSKYYKEKNPSMEDLKKLSGVVRHSYFVIKWKNFNFLEKKLIAYHYDFYKEPTTHNKEKIEVLITDIIINVENKTLTAHVKNIENNGEMANFVWNVDGKKNTFSWSGLSRDHPTWGKFYDVKKTKKNI